ncbi:MAG TPA: hypothetical protein P5565_09405, partial [Bacteroidia bacterium]|nr:hypothetical protein [Bacteroidia bacterium]
RSVSVRNRVSEQWLFLAARFSSSLAPRPTSHVPRPLNRRSRLAPGELVTLRTAIVVVALR